MPKKLQDKRGMTLMEVLMVVGILCVVLTIVVPGLVMIGRTLEFQKRNNYARSIFLAAQRQLVEMRSSGQLDMLTPDAGAVRQSGDGADIPPLGYVYTHSDAAAFAQILPAGSLDETIRENQILIEYDPESGSVYAVFYYEGRDDLAAQYAAGHLTRDEAQRKQQKLGYYDGSGQSDPDLGIYHVEADVRFENGQEGIVTVVVPAQAAVSGENINFMGDDYNAFANGLEVILTISGEQGGTFTKVIKSFGDTGNWTVGSGEGGVNAILVTCTLDSLLDRGSFASLPENDKTPDGEPAARSLTDIAEGDYVIIPGDNVSIAAEVIFRPGLEDPLVIIESGALAGVNPMFASLTPGTDGYILAISNGRNLQNLNALAPEIAKNVEAVVFFPEQAGKGAGEGKIIDWNDTVEYYRNLPGVSESDYNSEAPARRLPYFVPIQNACLFGTAEFLNADGAVPTLREMNLRGSKKNAQIVGNHVKICNLYMDAGGYAAGAAFYGVPGVAADQRLTGLFGYVNTNIDGISIVNPVIRGFRPDDDHAAASGALVGAAGEDSRISNCGTYIDTGASDFLRDNLNMTDFTGEEEQYGVSGWGAVGGLTGYIESDTNNAWAVSSCFAAVPVYGNMATGDFCGYRNGVGGLAGNAQMTGFSNCYASGTVNAKGCTVMTGVAPNDAGITAYGTESTGAGGFAGTSHGCRYSNCFASGNVRGTDSTVGSFAGVLCWDSIMGTRKTKLSGCYGAGTVCNGKTYGNFAGAAAILKPAQLPAALGMERCYYLSPYQEVQDAAPDSTPAMPVTYGALGSVTTAGFADWNLAAETHSYGENPAGEAYPFVLPPGITDYYGLWPEPQISMAVVYYENYGTGASPEMGYYADGWGINTLRDHMVTEDGYGILSASEHITAVAGEVTLELARDAGTVTVGGNAYYLFRLPLDALRAAAGEDFYAEVDLESEIWQDGKWKYSACCTVYVNPDAAMGQISTAAEMPPVPDTVQIRSARQLTALGREHMEHFLHLNFVQKTDIAFAGVDHQPIDGFSGTYNGFGTCISGLGESLFAANAGSIRNLHLQTEGEGNLAEINSGHITECTVTGSGTISVPGLVTVNQGTIADCSVDAAVLAEGSLPAGILLGQMLDGSIRDCSVSGSIDAGSDGAVGGVVGSMEAGRITGVTSDAVVGGTGAGKIGTFAGAVENGVLTDCHTTGENSLFPFAGFAAEVSSEAVHPDATHYLDTRWPDGIITREEVDCFRWMDEPHRKPKYAATFENCTFLLNGETRNAVGRQYYYQLEPLGGYQLAAADPEAASIDPGEYVLVTEDNRILNFTEGGSLEWISQTEETELLDGMIWRFDGENWGLQKTAVVKTEKTEAQTVIETVTEYTITAAVTIREGSGSSLAVTLDYTITAAVTETRTVGTAEPVVYTETKTSAKGSEACFLYSLAEETDYAATCVDTRDALVTPDGTE